MAVEAALVLTILMGAAVMGFDAARAVQMTARAERIAAVLADVASRSEGIRDRAAFDAETLPEDTGMLFELAREMAGAEGLQGGGVVVASISGGAGAAQVNWMRGSTPDLASAERLTAFDGLPQGVEVIVVEAVLPFNPAMLDPAQLGVGARVAGGVYGRAAFRPRSGTLVTLATVNE